MLTVPTEHVISYELSELNALLSNETVSLKDGFLFGPGHENRLKTLAHATNALNSPTNVQTNVSADVPKKKGLVNQLLFGEESFYFSFGEGCKPLEIAKGKLMPQRDSFGKFIKCSSKFRSYLTTHKQPSSAVCVGKETRECNMDSSLTCNQTSSSSVVIAVAVVGDGKSAGKSAVDAATEKLTGRAVVEVPATSDDLSMSVTCQRPVGKCSEQNKGYFCC